VSSGGTGWARFVCCQLGVTLGMARGGWTGSGGEVLCEGGSVGVCACGVWGVGQSLPRRRMATCGGVVKGMGNVCC